MAPAEDQVIIVVMAEEHGNRTQDQILAQKRQDIQTFGRTYWYGRASSIRPSDMRDVGPLRVYIIEQASRRSVAQNPFDAFTRWSLDGRTWQPFPPRHNPVTGSDRPGGWAIVLDQLDPQERSRLDLWSYSNLDGSPLQFTLADYAAHAIRRPSQTGMRSRMRELIAVGRLCEPYFVYLGT